MTPKPPDRARYEAQQAELLRALLRGEGYPHGFVIDKADAASQALRRKRARGVSTAWPALAAALGAQFAARFDAFARGAPPPAFGFGYTDGLQFARSLPDAERTDAIRVELLLAQAVIAGRGDAMRPRRGPFARATTLRDPHRILVVMRIPLVGRRVLVVPLGRC